MTVPYVCYGTRRSTNSWYVRHAVVRLWVWPALAFLMYVGFRVVLLLLPQVGCGDGGTRVMYHPKNSHNGALLAATRAPKKYAETTTAWRQQRGGVGVVVVV